MSSSASPLHLSLEVNQGSDATPPEHDQLARSLAAELKELDLESVGIRSAGPAPVGAKAADVAMIGALAIAVLPAVAPQLIGFLQSWTMRSANRTLKIKTQIGDRSIEVECSADAASREELNRLLETVSASLGSTRKADS